MRPGGGGFCGLPRQDQKDPLRYSLTGMPGVASRLNMISVSTSTWETTAGLALVACLVAGVVWIFTRRRPTADEVEMARRSFLAHSGRLVDGMLLDMCEMEASDGRTLTLLVYSYRIGGVDYECSQDITAMRDVVAPAKVYIGLPCSVRYQPGSPQNSIVVAEQWSGLRATLPELPGSAASLQAEPRRRWPRYR